LNLRLDLAYDGEPFRGFSKQHNVRTVQGDLEDALQRVLGISIELDVAGRTDAGVHALGQVCGASDAPEVDDLELLQRSLNGMCGPPISLHGLSIASAGWHARFSARSRTYMYALLESEEPDPFLTRTTWHQPGRLDVEAMNEAAGHLLGERDFSSFGKLPDGSASPVRDLFELRCIRRGRVVRIRARANAFIQQMVRSLIGTLVQVGQGKRSPDEIPTILGARDRSAAGPVAPPHGLCLVSVEYDEGWSRPPADG
jgi:tRNA pseudouridine38-40 synthase